MRANLVRFGSSITDCFIQQCVFSSNWQLALLCKMESRTKTNCIKLIKKRGGGDYGLKYKDINLNLMIYQILYCIYISNVTKIILTH